jgi:DivIVA domain-containing protein
VNVYGRSGGRSELLISSPQRGRAFLGAVKSQSALQPRLLDEKVSGVLLVDWAAWAASTTFSFTGLGYERREVDAFRSAVRDTFLGVSEPPVRSHDLRGKQFSTHRLGYDKTQVEAFVEAAGLRLAAMESTDRPAGAPVSGAILAGWAEWVESTGLLRVTGPACKAMEVDAFQEAIRDTFLGVRKPPMRSDEVRGKQFSSTHADHGVYEAFVEAAGLRLAAMESTDRPEEPLVSGAILAGWAEWVDSTRFETTRRLWEGYATVEVDAFRKELRDTFLGVGPPPLTWDEAHDKQFTPTRLRPGYKVEQVDAFLDKTEQRLAAMRSDVVRRALKSPSLLGYARRGLSSGRTYWISSADLDVGEVRFLCTLVTAPQDQRGTDEPGHHQVKDREVDIPGPGENEDGQPGEVPDRCRPPDPAGYEFRHRQGAADGCLADEGQGHVDDEHRVHGR